MVAMVKRSAMDSRRHCILPLLLVLLLGIILGSFTFAQGKEELEGFFEDGLDNDELDAPYVAPVRTTRAASTSAADVGVDPVIKPPVSRKADPLEYWDEDEFEGLPVEEEPESGFVAAPEGDLEAEPLVQQVVKSKRIPYLEAAGAVFFLIYAVVFWYGRKENEKIALAWATEFAGTDSILEKNFSVLGFGDEPDAPSLVKEGQNTFKFYASGRRYCESLLASIVLKNRQDLLSQLLYLVVPAKDEITFQINMNDDAMEPVVFALAKKKVAKDMQREVKDLNQFATVLTPPTSRKWVAEDLSVISESRDLAYDLLPEPFLDQVFGEKAFKAFAPYFVSLHFSDQFPESNQKKVLQFTFCIPALAKLSEMKRLVALVPYFIDVMGRYKMPSGAKTKASTVREKLRAEEYKEATKIRQEALQKKKSEQQTPLSSKKEEKERLRQLKKSMPKVKMSRGH